MLAAKTTFLVVSKVGKGKPHKVLQPIQHTDRVQAIEAISSELLYELRMNTGNGWDSLTILGCMSMALS